MELGAGSAARSPLHPAPSALSTWATGHDRTVGYHRQQLAELSLRQMAVSKRIRFRSWQIRGQIGWTLLCTLWRRVALRHLSSGHMKKPHRTITTTTENQSHHQLRAGPLLRVSASQLDWFCSLRSKGDKPHAGCFCRSLGAILLLLCARLVSNQS